MCSDAKEARAHCGAGYRAPVPPTIVSYNAYTGEVNPEPNSSVDYRTGAGHIHIGWGEDLGLDDPEHKEACEMLAKQLDMHLAMPALLFDTDYERRNLYGKIGFMTLIIALGTFLFSPVIKKLMGDVH